MSIRRTGQVEFSSSSEQDTPTLVLGAGSLHQAADMKPRGPANPDERISLFWRVFGGTILTIIALVAISLYNNLSNSIAELRSEVHRINEARAELVKKEEFNSRTQSVWDRVQNLQDTKIIVTSLKEQVSAQQEKLADLKGMQERLSQLEQRIKLAEEDHKALTKAESAINGLEQKSAVRESQLKAADDERREIIKQLQELRERLAKVEGVTETKPMPKSGVEARKGE